MTDPLSVEFADPASGVRGWIGRGVPGTSNGEAVVLLFEGEKPLIAGTAEAEASIVDGGATAKASSDTAAVSVEVSPGVEVGPLWAGRAKVEIEIEGKKRSLSCAGAFGAPAASDDAGLVRALVALRDDGSALALRAARPGDGAEHGAERVEAWLAGGDSLQPRAVEEALLSTEYQHDGEQARAGLELWLGAEDQMPLRGAGTRSCGASVELDGWLLRAAFFDWTIEGIGGSGSYLIWRRGDG
ncbi:MAG: hypothetical protein ACXWES_03955 [Solirubrobacterales bacterium]